MRDYLSVICLISSTSWEYSHQLKRLGSEGVMNNILYEDKAKYDTWLIILLGGIIVLVVIIGFIEWANGTGQAPGLFGAALFIIVLFRLILPRRFQIQNQKLRIVLGGGPFAFNIPLADIKEARPRTGIKAFFYAGIRFATAANHTVEIVRHRGLNVVISPTHHEEFVKQLTEAINEIIENDDLNISSTS